MSTSCTKEFTLKINSAVPDYYAYYKLDEASMATPLIDKVSGFNIASASAASMVSVTGKIAGSVTQVPGPTVIYEYGETAHFVFFSSFTIRFWYKWGGISSPGVILHSGLNGQWEIRQATSGPNTFVELFCSTNPGSATVDGENLTAGIWQRVICWFESGVGSGVKMDNNVPHLQATSSPLDVPFTGDVHLQLSASDVIDEIAIWNRKITDAEMLADWNGGNGVTYP